MCKIQNTKFNGTVQLTAHGPETETGFRAIASYCVQIQQDIKPSGTVQSLQSYLTYISYTVLSLFNVKWREAKKKRLESLQYMHSSKYITKTKFRNEDAYY